MSERNGLPRADWNMPPGVSAGSIPGNSPDEDESCGYCGASGDGVELEWFEDKGDSSVGYGPELELLCQECAERLGLEERQQ
jgi:hypothetical protein